MLNYILNINNSFDLTNNTHVSETNGMLLFIVSNSLWQCGKMFDIVKIIWTFCAFHTVAIVKLRYWSISNSKRTTADTIIHHHNPPKLFNIPKMEGPSLISISNSKSWCYIPTTPTQPPTTFQYSLNIFWQHMLDSRLGSHLRTLWRS